MSDSQLAMDLGGGPGTLVFPAGSQPVDTSEDAADSLSRAHLARLRRAVLAYFGGRGEHGATPDEVAVEFQVAHNTTSPRITELAQLGYLERTEDRRPTRSGRNAGVYRITGSGRRTLELVG